MPLGSVPRPPSFCEGTAFCGVGFVRERACLSPLFGRQLLASPCFSRLSRPPTPTKVLRRECDRSACRRAVPSTLPDRFEVRSLSSTFDSSERRSEVTTLDCQADRSRPEESPVSLAAAFSDGSLSVVRDPDLCLCGVGGCACGGAAVRSYARRRKIYAARHSVPSAPEPEERSWRAVPQQQPLPSTAVLPPG